MSVELWIAVGALIAIPVSAVALYFALRRAAKEFETKAEVRFDSLDAKIDGVRVDLTELRVETREILARDDEHISSLERQRPGLLAP